MKNDTTLLIPKSESKLNALTRRIKEAILQKKFMVFAFFAPILIMLLTFACTGMLFGKTSFLALDMNAQYVYFFEQFRDILTGNESFFYTFERSMGGEFFGYFTYYLASPLSFLVLIFPKSMIYEAIGIMLLLKSGLSGLSFSIYLYKTRPVNSIGFGMFSVMYAFCAFATAYQTNIMWLDALIWLPLIALGIEALIKEGKFKLFVVALSMAIWSNYYIGYMLCIFTALYFVFYLATHSSKDRNPKGVKLHILKSFGRLALFSAISLMICAGVLLSALYALSFGKANFDLSKLTFEINLDFFDIVSKMFIGTFDTFRSEGFPHIYSGTLTLLLLPVFFASKKIKLREKIGYSLLATVFIISFSINAINLAWHCFNSPVWLNYRYSFMLSFVFLIMAYKGYEQIKSFKFKFFAISTVFIVLLLFMVQKMVKFTRYDGSEKTELGLGLIVVGFTIALLAGYLVIFLLMKLKKNKIRAISLVLCGIVCLEATAGATLSWYGQFDDAGFSTRANYNAFKENNKTISEYFEEKEIDSFFRVERTYSRKTNDNLVLNLNGVSEFTSTFNNGSKTLLKRLGYTTKDQSALYKFTNELSDSLLGIKYVVSDELINEETDSLDKESMYEQIEVIDGKYAIYENKYALSIAYAVSPKINEATLDKNMSPDDYAIYLAELMLDRNFTSVNTGSMRIIYSDLSRGELKVSEFSDTNIKGTLTTSGEKVIFTSIPYDKMWQVYVDGERVDTYKCVDSMLAFDVSSKDTHTYEIEMKYVPMQWYVGLIVTALGIVAFTACCLIERKIKLCRMKRAREKENL